jgi:serine/threonine-protein kinase 24/25/MST4
MALTSERFELGPRIGRGSAGDVHTARDKLTDDVVAVKLVDLEEAEDEVEDIQREISYLMQCSSPFVTKYLGCWLDPGSTRLAIAMEYMAGGSVADLISDAFGGPLPESACAVVCRDLLYALDYLHGEGKIHRDVKCANVLLTGAGEIRLADFGVAGTLTQTLGGNKRRTFTGTPFWMAPEVIQAHESDGYNSKCDIWSLGITAMEAANGTPPYSDLHPMRVLFFIPKNPPPRLEGASFSAEFKEFCASCLQKDPDRRPRAAQLVNHRFIADAPERCDELVDRVTRRMRGETRVASTSEMNDSPSNATAEDTRASTVQNHKASAPSWDFGDGTLKRFNKPGAGPPKMTDEDKRRDAVDDDSDEEDADYDSTVKTRLDGEETKKVVGEERKFVAVEPPRREEPPPRVTPDSNIAAVAKSTPAIASVLSPAASLAASGRGGSVGAAAAAAAVTAALAKLELEASGSTAAMLVGILERLSGPVADTDPDLRTAAARARLLFGGSEREAGGHASTEPAVREPEVVPQNALADFLLARWQRDLKPASSYVVPR